MAEANSLLSVRRPYLQMGTVGMLGKGWLKGHGLKMFQITNFWAPRTDCSI